MFGIMAQILLYYVNLNKNILNIIRAYLRILIISWIAYIGYSGNAARILDPYLSSYEPFV